MWRMFYINTPWEYCIKKWTYLWISMQIYSFKHIATLTLILYCKLSFKSMLSYYVPYCGFLKGNIWKEMIIISLPGTWNCSLCSVDMKRGCVRAWFLFSLQICLNAARVCWAVPRWRLLFLAGSQSWHPFVKEKAAQ